MNTQWILIANASTARLYGRASPEQHLELLAERWHPESRLKGSELGRDRPGHEAADQSSASTRFEAQTDLHRKELQHFAKELAEQLERGLVEGRYDSLYLVVSNPMLGELKSRLSGSVAKHVKGAHAADFTSFKVQALEQRLHELGMHRA